MPQVYPQAPLGQNLIHGPYQPQGQLHNVPSSALQQVPIIWPQLQVPVLPPEGQYAMPGVLPCNPPASYQHLWQMLPGAGSEQQQFHPQQIDEIMYSASEESFKERVKCRLDLREITVELTVDNYQRKFNNLICWEEKSNIEILGRK